MSLSSRAAGTSTLRLENVSLELGGKRVLDAVDMTIEPDVPAVVTGPSGSGKSVLCLVLAGQLAPTTGRVLLGDATLTKRDAASVGVVLQEHGLVAGLTVIENVALPLQELGLPPSEVVDQSEKALTDVGLMREADRLVEDLSGGERQRVGIARAIAGAPQILVADEPTSELDPDNRERVLQRLTGERVRSKVTVVASDDPEILQRFERTFVIRQGKVTRVEC